MVSLGLASLAGYAVLNPSDIPSGVGLQAFLSKRDLVNFLDTGRSSGFDLLAPYSQGLSERTTLTGDSLPYSETNVQTSGVDEGDIVKTDGEYIFVAESSQVTIVMAVPPEDMKVVSTIKGDELISADDDHRAYARGLFASGDRLVVLWDIYLELQWYRYAADAEGISHEPPRTLVSVFDISNRSSPSLEFSVGVSGSSLTSRMIGDVVYVVAQLAVGEVDEENVLPRVWEDGQKAEIALSSVRYDPETMYPSIFVNLLAVDTSTQEHSCLSIVSDWTSTVYMSAHSLFFTVQKWSGDVSSNEIGFSPARTDSARTTIYKIAVQGIEMREVARGDVRGWLLNQFSMDQHEGNLRVATTTDWSDPENAVYVLDDELKPLGALEGLAPSERIYSARFVGSTLYLVTFRQIDPLFVIDLTNPSKPKVAGELKIPGFSTYLHPVDESHVLGIGQDNGSVKVSLFDVSDPTAPFEKSMLVIDGSFSSSALYEHKAVLFDRDRELLVLPGQVYRPVWENGTYYFNHANPAAYVLRVSLTEGISIRGVVLQEVGEEWSWYDVARSLYIGDCLYTLSDVALQANMLDDLSFVGKVTLEADPWSYYVY